MKPLWRTNYYTIVFFILLLAASGSISGESAMGARVVQEAGFTVIGIAVRTNNTREATADSAIGKRWGRFMQEGIWNKIPNKADTAIVAVYADYASDKDGEYTYVLGAKVTSDVDIPAGMVAKKVPAGRYAVFTSEKGPAPKVVPELWKKIWAVPKTEAGGDRAYKADFEVYDARATDPANIQMDIYIGIK